MDCGDADGDRFSITPSKPPHGTVGDVHPGTGPGFFGKPFQFSYHADAGYTGDDTLSFTLDDHRGTPTTFTPTVTVEAADADAAPTCSVSGPQPRTGEATKISVDCEDGDGDPLTITVGTPHHGTVGPLTDDPRGRSIFETDPKVVTYTSAAGYDGYDSIVVTAADGHAQSTPARYTFLLRSFDDNIAPSCSDEAVSARAGLAAEVYDPCGDADDDPLTETIADGPHHGTLSAPDADGLRTYRPDAGFTGTDTVGVKANDGRADSNTATITFTVVSDAPQTTKAQADAGESIAQPGFDDGTSPATPTLAAVTTPNAGPVSLTEKAPETTAPSGYSFLGRQYDITAPAATADAPLRLEFVVDASALPSGTDAGNLVVFRNGAPIADCSGAVSPKDATETTYTHAVPDPCVARRQALPGGDVRVVVLSSHASTWNLGKAAAALVGRRDHERWWDDEQRRRLGGHRRWPAGRAARRHQAQDDRRDASGRAHGQAEEGLAVAPAGERPVGARHMLGGVHGARRDQRRRPHREAARAREEDRRRGPHDKGLTGTAIVKVKVSAKARKALRHAKSVTLHLQVVAADGAGNPGRSKPATVTVRR